MASTGPNEPAGTTQNVDPRSVQTATRSSNGAVTIPSSIGSGGILQTPRLAPGPSAHAGMGSAEAPATRENPPNVGSDQQGIPMKEVKSGNGSFLGSTSVSAPLGGAMQSQLSATGLAHTTGVPSLSSQQFRPETHPSASTSSSTATTTSVRAPTNQSGSPASTSSLGPHGAARDNSNNKGPSGGLLSSNILRLARPEYPNVKNIPPPSAPQKRLTLGVAATGGQGAATSRAAGTQQLGTGGRNDDATVSKAGSTGTLGVGTRSTTTVLYTDPRELRGAGAGPQALDDVGSSAFDITPDDTLPAKGYFATFYWRAHLPNATEALLDTLPQQTKLLASIPAMFHQVIVILQYAAAMMSGGDILRLLDKKIAKPTGRTMPGLHDPVPGLTANTRPLVDPQGKQPSQPPSSVTFLYTNLCSPAFSMSPYHGGTISLIASPSWLYTYYLLS